jgi:DNA-binding SARP family transcriptional activator
MGQPDPPIAPPDSALTLQTLGGALLALSSGEERLGPGKPLALIAYLACSPRRAAAREQLVDLLWADLEPDKARHALRQTIWYLRQILGPSGLTTHGAELQLSAPLRLDRDDFLAAVGVGDLAAAADLYRGDFLAGFAAPGSVEFEHWADVERQRLRTAFLRVAQRLVRTWLDGGRFREATVLARRLRDTARSSEAGWRLLLESQLAAGDQLGFTLESSALALMLEAEGREPEPATRALLARDDRPAGSPAPASRSLTPALIGREREFGRISAAWDRVMVQHGHHLHIMGAAGLGKTRLLADVHYRLRSLGARVVSLRANPGDRAIPYSFAGELARALANLPGAAGISPSTAGTLVALHPSLSGRFSAPSDTATGNEALRRRSSALGELLSVVSEEQPYAVLLDDLHWADAASRQALRPLIERLQTTRVLLVTSARPGTSLDAQGQESERLDLRPLTVPHILELLASLGQLPDEEWSRSLPTLLHAVTGGSPLLVLETLQLALDREVLRLAAGQWHCAAPVDLPAHFEAGSALRTRIERLEREPRWLLLLLALAGTPLGLHRLTQAARRGGHALEGGLVLLEQSGLADRSGDVWQPAHDEIAACAEDLATPDELQLAHRDLAEMYASPAEARRTDLIRAAEHLGLARANPGDVRRVFLRYVGIVRREGDRRALSELAGEFLEERPAAEARALVGGVGGFDRIRHSGRLGVGMLGLALLILAVAALARPRPGVVPDAELLIGSRGAAGESTREVVPVFRKDWDPDRPISLEQATRFSVNLPLPNMSWPIPSPDGAHSLIIRQTGDSTTYDIYLTDPSGRATRVVGYPRDDNAASWAPDGSAFVFTTAYWSPPGYDNYDIALYDLTTGAARRLTGGRGADNFPLYSPEGSRIGFSRTNDDAPTQFCWVAPDTTGGVHCVTPRNADMVGWAGWLNEADVLVVYDAEGRQDVGRLSLETGRVDLLERNVDAVTLSPDGSWMTILSQRPGTSTPQIYVEPVDAPERRRVLELTDQDPASAAIGWRWPAPPTGFLDRLEFNNLPDSIASDAAFLAPPVGFDAAGREHPINGPLRWSVSDTSVLRVDSTGVVRPVRTGEATLTVSVGGWRAISRVLRVVAARRNSVLKEGWTGGITDNFIPFGTPLPALTTGPQDVRAFWNRGDGSYQSGAYSRRAWDASRGLGVEARISTKITRGQFQVATLSLLGGLDSAGLGGWDHRTSGMPVDPAIYTLRSCVIGYPSREGPLGTRRIGISTGPATRSLVTDTSLMDGHWYRLRLQIFQDGRCGAALDGRPLWISEKRLKTDRPYAVMLGYASNGTKVLHGPLEVWQGVRDDVQWSLLDP